MKISINFGPYGLGREVIGYRQAETVHSGVLSAFRQLGDVIVPEIEFVGATPPSSTEPGNHVAELTVVLCDSSLKDRNGRYTSRNLGEFFDEQMVKNAVIEMVQHLFEQKADRLNNAQSELQTQIVSLNARTQRMPQ